MQRSTDYTSVYNDLPSVVDADHSLESIGRPSSIRRLLAVIERHGKAGEVGLRLLHKHNDVNYGERMVEYGSRDDQGFALITSPSIVPEENADIVPNSWILVEDCFVPVEFSERRVISRPDISPLTEPALFKELAEVLRSLRLTGLVGPALEPSYYVLRNQSPAKPIMYEFSALDARANVIRYVGEDAVLGGKSIETFWSVSEEEDNSTTLKCIRWCPYVQDPPVHQGTYIHSPGKTGKVQ